MTVENLRWICRQPPARRRWLCALVVGLLSTPSLPALEKEPRFVRISIEEGLSHSAVRAIHQDSRGFMWFGTQEGLNRYDGYGFKVFKNRPDDPSSLSESRVTAIYEDSRDVLWIGTWGGGLDRFRNADESFVTYRHDADDPRSLSHDVVRCILEDGGGTLWIGTEDGLNRFRRREDGFRRYRHDPAAAASLGGRSVGALYVDGAGELWVGTDRGLDRFDRRTETFVGYRHDPADPRSLSRGGVAAIREDREGRLWIATESGLERLDRSTGAFSHYRHDPSDPISLSEDKVLSLHLDRSGELWIGLASRGLDRLADLSGTFRHVRADPFNPESLSDGSVLSIYEDRTGILWFGTSVGINKYDRPGDAGDSHAPPIVITDFRLFNESVPLQAVDPDSPLEKTILETRELTLSHRDYVFAFEFAALHYASPRHNRYAYRLEGFDRDWVERDATKRFAQYTNLAPGKYLFRVKGSNNGGVWNEQGAAIRVVVLPAPWKTWWARALYVLVTAAAVLIVVRLVQRKIERERAINRRLRETDRLKDQLLEQRREQIEERERLIAELGDKNAELERFTYTVSHDLTSPLFTIKGFLGLVKKDLAAGDGERVGRDLDRISAATDTLQRLLEELLEFSRVGRVVDPSAAVSLFQVAHEAVGMVEEKLAERGVEVVIRPELPTVVGDRDRLREVFQHLLDNAARFMGDQKEPCVEVGVRQDRGDDVVCFVRDNGIGIETQYHEKVFGLFERLNAEDDGTGIGLALVKRIVELHGGRIWVESAGRGHGSTFWLTLPRGSSSRSKTA